VSAAASRSPRSLVALLIATSLLIAAVLAVPAQSHASRGMELALQDDATFIVGSKRVSARRAFDLVRALGVTRLRVNLLWAYTLPASQYNARRKPSTLSYSFNQFDQLVDSAAKRGIRIHLSLTGPPPRWANPKHSLSRGWYKPDTRAFGAFAAVVAEHFRGRVDRYSIWNEPNWKTWLGPLNSAASIYRGLYTRGYAAIKKADPRAKVLIGETSPFARKNLSTAPLAFLRQLTCVNSKYKRTRRCPVLKTDGFAHHPYDFRHSPTYQYPGADNVTIGTLSRLTTALDKLSRAGALRFNGGGRMPVYLTEYGYFASGHRALPVKQRTRYLQQAYSIALKNSRVKSQLQYLLLAPPPNSDSAFFNLALLSPRGAHYPQYGALQRWFNANRGKVKRPGSAISIPAAQPNPTTAH
jgi:Cellulase (glycosyl hydrolase family 5)